MRVSVNVLRGNGNAVECTKQFARGIVACGDQVDVRTENDTKMIGYDAVVLWGFTTPCQQVIRAAVDRGIPWVFLDLGYWRRDKGYFKVTVNDRHPDRYFMRTKRAPDRWRALGLKIEPRNPIENGYVLIAGMSGKAAWAWGLQNEAWENQVAQSLRKVTKRQIIYRPKPNWNGAKVIPGTTLDKSTPLDKALRSAHVVVAHHSNVGCDALLVGTPVISKRGAASILGPYDVGSVENPKWPTDDERAQWAYNLAYCQWTTHEMANGACWRSLRENGLVF